MRTVSSLEAPCHHLQASVFAVETSVKHLLCPCLNGSQDLGVIWSHHEAMWLCNCCVEDSKCTSGTIEGTPGSFLHAAGWGRGGGVWTLSILALALSYLAKRQMRHICGALSKCQSGISFQLFGLCKGRCYLYFTNEKTKTQTPKVTSLYCPDTICWGLSFLGLSQQHLCAICSEAFLLISEWVFLSPV